MCFSARAIAIRPRLTASSPPLQSPRGDSIPLPQLSALNVAAPAHDRLSHTAELPWSRASEKLAFS
jgi:hypothetical protein